MSERGMSVASPRVASLFHGQMQSHNLGSVDLGHGGLQQWRRVLGIGDNHSYVTRVTTRGTLAAAWTFDATLTIQ